MTHQPYRFVGIHKRKALFDCQMQEESFDVPVTSRTVFCRAFQEIEDFFFLFIMLIVLLGKKRQTYIFYL